MNVTAVLDQRADELPDQPAIVETRRGRDRTLSFRELQYATSHLAGQLVARGVRTDDRVAMLTPVSIELYVALIGVLRLGAVPVVVDPSLGLGGMRRCFRRVQPAAVVAAGRGRLVAPFLPELRRTIRLRVTADRTPASFETRTVTSDQPALLTFTSGSTGEPKAVVRSHGLLLAQNTALAKVLGQSSGEASLATLPIFVLAHLAAGVTSIVAAGDLRHPGAIDAGPILDQMERWKPQCTVASSALLLRLAAAIEDGRPLRHRFRDVYTGGAPVFPDMVRRLNVLTDADSVVIVYGSTEAEPIAHVERLDDEMLEAIRSGAGLPAGVPVEDADVRVIRDQWGEPIEPLDAEAFDRLSVPTSEPGEIVVAGDHVVQGYLDGIGDDETKIHVGERVWHRTGDAGSFDERGRLWLLGRCSAKAQLGDRVIYPFAVEAAARAVTGRRTAFLEHEGAAILFVETDDGRVDDDARTAAAVFGPLEIRPIDRVPLDARHNAKVDYTALRSLAAGR